MTIEFKDGRYFSQIWFLEGKERDWLAALYKDPGGKWVLQYRFRYYEEDPKKDPFHDNDRKSWYTYNIDPSKSEETLLRECDFVAESMQAAGFGLPHHKLHKLLLRSDDMKVVMAAFESEEWCHTKMLTPEEAAKEWGIHD